MKLENTIVAISTAIGQGGISIIRLSGKSACEIADKVFSHKKYRVSEFEPRKLHLGEFNYDNIKDKCMCVYFKAPYSYTGEDVVEFQCHGGLTLTNKIYEALVKCGATPASKGEFSKLAFLNGKLSLDEAEGVIDMINAESESELKAGYSLMQGDLKKEVENIQNILTETLAKIEVTLDYPEEDLEEETASNISATLQSIKDRLSHLLDNASYGKAIKDGTKILIYGKTNAGKSSLLNALLNYDRAIVTDIKGTTRDVIEETFIYKGHKFIIIDTAGIRETTDIVENLGINRSKEMLKCADIVLFVVDGSEKLNSDDLNIVNTLSDKNTIVVVNKSDLEQKAELEKIPFNRVIKISAVSSENIDTLKEEILTFVTRKYVNNNSIVITNVRHIEAIKSALKSLDVALDNLANLIQLDLISIDIKNVWLALGDITGNSDNERIINDIFEKFCVGK